MEVSLVLIPRSSQCIFPEEARFLEDVLVMGLGVSRVYVLGFRAEGAGLTA